MIRLYTQPHCPFCDIMKQKLDEAEIDYVTINIQEDYDAKMYLKDRGHRTVPVLYYEDTHLNSKDTIDYSIEELRELVAQQQVSNWITDSWEGDDEPEWAWQDSGIEEF